MIAFLTAAICLGSLQTVGRTASADAQIAERLDSAGSRIIQIRDVQDAGLISQSIVASGASLNTVERLAAVTSPVDATSSTQGVDGSRIPLWVILSEIGDAIVLTSGRLPLQDEVIISESAADTLGFDGSVGTVETAGVEYPVVGTFVARDAFDALNAGGILPTSGQKNAASLYVLVRSAEQAANTQAAILDIIAPQDPTSLQVQSPVALADLQRAVRGDFGSFGRWVLLLVVGAGSLLSSVVVLADVLVRRIDIGRRRALGASRPILIALVVLRVTWGILAGAAAGCATGLVIGEVQDNPPPIAFATSVFILSVLSGGLAAVFPAFFAATRDPVRIIRTP